VDFLTIDGYDYAGTRDKQTNESSSLYDAAGDPLSTDARNIDATVKTYRKASVPAAKYTMGLPLYAVGWTGALTQTTACTRPQRVLPQFSWPTDRVCVSIRARLPLHQVATPC
jgi:GH18 family chitinase